jgi:hypothetical protein
MRGYQERQSGHPRTIFDTTLPVWRMGGCLLDAPALANQLSRCSATTTVRFVTIRLLWGGRRRR